MHDGVSRKKDLLSRRHFGNSNISFSSVAILARGGHRPQHIPLLQYAYSPPAGRCHGSKWQKGIDAICDDTAVRQVWRETQRQERYYDASAKKAADKDVARFVTKTFQEKLPEESVTGDSR